MLGLGHIACDKLWFVEEREESSSPVAWTFLAVEDWQSARLFGLHEASEEGVHASLLPLLVLLHFVGSSPES